MRALVAGSPVYAVRQWFSSVLSARVRRYAALTFFVDAGLIFALLVAVQSYLAEQHHTNAALAGYALAAYGAAKLAGQLGAGWLIDRTGPKRGLISGLCLTTAGQAAMILAVVQTGALLPATALYGIGAALIWPSVFHIASNEFAESQRARLSAGMTVATGLGVAAALALGIALPANFPYEAAIVVSLLSTMGALLSARAIASGASTLHPAERTEGHSFLSLLRAIASPRRLAFSLIILVQAAILGAILAIFRSYGSNTLHVSLREELILLIPAGAAGAGAVLVGGSLADRIGRIPVLGAGYLLVTVAIWSLSTTNAVTAVIPLTIVAAVGLAMALPCTGALSMDLSRGAGTGTLLGFFLTMEGAGHAIGPAVAGYLNDAGGSSVVLWLVGGLAAVIALIAIVPPIWSRPPANAPPQMRLGALVSGIAKGTLVMGVVFPALASYFAWDSSSQLYGHMITHGPRDQMEVAITFDDGPNDPWTLRIADVLDRYEVRGTFFTVGQNATVHPEIVRELVRKGHLIGNHSFRHKKRDAVLDPNYSDLWKAEGAIAAAAGVCPALYRPPNGFHTPWQLHAVARHRMATVSWDVIPRDWKDPPPNEIVSRVLSSVKPGSIILLHDGDDTNLVTDRSATLAALPGIIEGLRQKGYQIVRLDQLLSASPYLATCDGLQEGTP